MAFEIHNSFGIGIVILILELLFWVFVGYRVIKYGKNRKNQRK